MFKLVVLNSRPNYVAVELISFLELIEKLKKKNATIQIVL